MGSIRLRLLHNRYQSHKLDKLITALRTAVDNDGMLDKDQHRIMTFLMPLDWR